MEIIFTSFLINTNLIQFKSFWIQGEHVFLRLIWQTQLDGYIKMKNVSYYI